MTAPTGIQTGVGLAQVLHRAALAVECVDAVTAQLTRTPVRVGREVAARPPAEPGPTVDLDASAVGRFVLRHRPTLPNVVTLRVTAPDRRFVARRLTVPLWTLAEVALADAVPPGPYVPVRSRLLRPWLSPGSAYDLPGGSTAVRGRVTRAGTPVRWARVTAFEKGVATGWAHGDDRGEFLLVLAESDEYLPAAITVDLEVLAPDPAGGGTADPTDPFADLPTEDLARSSAPPVPGDLDNPVLRGHAPPPGYVTSTAPRRRLALEVGEVHTVAGDIAFTV